MKINTSIVKVNSNSTTVELTAIPDHPGENPHIFLKPLMGSYSTPIKLRDIPYTAMLLVNKTCVAVTGRVTRSRVICQDMQSVNRLIEYVHLELEHRARW